jgi:hypothetical protein
MQMKQKQEIKKMTKLLEQVFDKVSKLPDREQNVVAKWILEEMEMEKSWDKTFAESENILDNLADEAISDHKKHKTKFLNTAFL